MCRFFATVGASTFFAYSNPTNSGDDTSALTLPITCFSYALVVIIWGLLPEPELNLYDAFVACLIFYFMTVGLVVHSQTRRGFKVHSIAALIMTTSLVLALLVVAHHMPNFGKSPECFHGFFILFGAKISVEKLKILMLVFGYLFTVLFLCVLFLRHRFLALNNRILQDNRSPDTNRQLRSIVHSRQCPNRRQRRMRHLCIIAGFVDIFWMINLEYTTNRNRELYNLPVPRWTLAQVLAVLLTVPSLIRVGMDIYDWRKQRNGADNANKEEKEVDQGDREV
ncbi:hypothetical protein AX16_008774 [Volvariella volvacea WC 439]|nr:hypothetical protein AX16_008774 [Volvariella volvacea WC 439]